MIAALSVYATYFYALCPYSKGGLRFVIVHPFVRQISVVTKVEKWGHPCPIDTFLVTLFYVLKVYQSYRNLFNKYQFIVLIFVTLR